MDRKSKLRLTISAVACSVFLGGTSIVLKNLHSDNFTIPFYRDSLKTYGVSSKEISIKKVGESKPIEKEVDKTFLLLNEIENKDSIIASIASPFVLEKREKAFSKETEDVYVSHVYDGTFNYGSLTNEEIEEKIDLFKKEEFKEVIEGCNYSYTYQNTNKGISNEEIDKDNYSATLKVNSVDLEDIKFKKQSIGQNIAETAFFSLFTFVGAYTGISIGNYLNNKAKPKVKTKVIERDIQN